MDSNFKKPREKGYTVYTKSKCDYCVYVKTLLSEMNDPEPLYIDCDQILIEKKEEFLKCIEELVGKEYRKFPMVFYNGVCLGGFRETQEYVDTVNAFGGFNTDF